MFPGGAWARKMELVTACFTALLFLPPSWNTDLVPVLVLYHTQHIALRMLAIAYIGYCVSSIACVGYCVCQLLHVSAIACVDYCVCGLFVCWRVLTMACVVDYCVSCRVCCLSRM